MPQHPTLDIRFYNSTGTQRRLQSKDTSITSARWKSVRYGGFDQADFTLAGSLLELTESDSASGRQPVREHDRCRVYVILPDGTIQLRWSGRVKSVRRTVGQPNTVQVECTGIFADVAAVPVDGRFISPVPVDVTQAFASFAYVEAQTAYPDLVVEVDNADVGVLTQAEDAFNKNLGAALSGFAERFSGLVVYGCDEFHDGDISQPITDRLFLRSVSSTTDPDYTFDIPGGFNGARFDMAEGGKDTTRLANILTITGTDPLYPNYLGEACNGNVGFERPVFADFASSPLLTDPSFETAVLSPWTLGGGATQKVGSIEGIPARTGDRLIELDDVNESVSRTVTTSLTAGQSLVVGVHARREDAGFGGTVRIRIQFKNGAFDVGSAQDATFSPETVYWQTYSHQVTVPSGTLTGFEVSFTATVSSGTNRGIFLDDAFAYIALLRQDGWHLRAEGTAVKQSEDWVHFADRRQGRYSVKFDINAADTDGNDCYLQPVRKFTVTPGAQLIFGCDIRCWDGETNQKLRLDLRYYKEDGSEISGSGDLLEFANGTIGDTWEQITNTSTVPNDAALCLPRVTFRGNNKVYLDRMFVRDSVAPSVVFQDVVETEWIDSGPYRVTIDTDDDAFISKPYANSIGTYGRRYEQIQSDSVVDRATAYAVAQGFFDVYALPLARPVLSIQGSPIAFQCGQTIRIAGEAGQWLGGTPETGQPSLAYAIAEIEESLDNNGKLTTTLSMEVEQPSLEGLIARIFDKKRRSTTGGGVSSLAGSPVGGSGGVSQTLPLPLSIANGGTAATTAADARTSLGLGSGLSVTIPLAKITPGGTDGSITTTNGVITARTDPT